MERAVAAIEADATAESSLHRGASGGPRGLFQGAAGALDGPFAHAAAAQACPSPTAAPQPRVEQVADRIAEHVEAIHAGVQPRSAARSCDSQ